MVIAALSSYLFSLLSFFHSARGGQTLAPCAQSSPLPAFVNKTALGSSHSYCTDRLGPLSPFTAELSCCARGHVAFQAPNIYPLAYYRKSVVTSALDSKLHEDRYLEKKKKKKLAFLIRALPVSSPRVWHIIGTW